jgi:hypothetical protein
VLYIRDINLNINEISLNKAQYESFQIVNNIKTLFFLYNCNNQFKKLHIWETASPREKRNPEVRSFVVIGYLCNNLL